MPIYEYRCRNGHAFEVLQSMTDDQLTACEQCGAPVERVFHPVAVHFKGSGFYTTDYARKAAKPGGDGDTTKSDGDSKGDPAAKDKDSGKDGASASKPAEKATTKAKSD
jgi:putative FmdB family regulatory protein